MERLDLRNAVHNNIFLLRIVDENIFLKREHHSEISIQRTSISATLSV